MKKTLINIAVSCVKIMYLCFKPFKLKHKVTIISRQANEPTLDIRLLRDQLVENGTETAVLTKKINGSFLGLISYGIHMFSQMYHIATSKVLVLDGYSILVSVLPKKKNQQVIQMWHALGAVKKFGWQSIESPDGHSRDVAEAMKMHNNYDYVFAPCKITAKTFAEAFRIPEDKIAFYGLPRIDFLLKKDDKNKAAIVSRYPNISLKTNVLYVPTFRKNAELSVEKLIGGFDFSNLNLIIKKHFLDKSDYSWAEKAGAIIDTEFSSMEWLRICEKIITDYSAIAFEAAVLEKDIYIYQPDADDYKHNVGLNIVLEDEAISEYVCKTEEELFHRLSQIYDKSVVIDFKQKYIEICIDNCTSQICSFIAKLLCK